jgi:hypothetical protein
VIPIAEWSQRKCDYHCKKKCDVLVDTDRLQAFLLRDNPTSLRLCKGIIVFLLYVVSSGTSKPKNTSFAWLAKVK